MSVSRINHPSSARYPFNVGGGREETPDIRADCFDFRGNYTGRGATIPIGYRGWNRGEIGPQFVNRGNVVERVAAGGEGEGRGSGKARGRIPPPIISLICIRSFVVVIKSIPLFLLLRYFRSKYENGAL